MGDVPRLDMIFMSLHFGLMAVWSCLSGSRIGAARTSACRMSRLFQHRILTGLIVLSLLCNLLHQEAGMFRSLWKNSFTFMGV